MTQYRPVYSTVHQKAVDEWNSLPDTVREMPWMVLKAEFIHLNQLAHFWFQRFGGLPPTD
jgi:hypothetical protein